jgi:1-acyl-sn-glycerol-3-phosphate acyltransferase
MDFKGGLFLMAAKTKVPIVPITLSHTHAIMPGNSLCPVQRGAGKLHVHVHEAIDTEGKTEEEMSALVKAAFLATLPLEQHPHETIQSADELHETIPSAEELQSLSAASVKNITVAV